MSFAEWFLIVPTLSYIGASGVYASQGRLGFALAYFAYALANVGLILAAVSGGEHHG